MSDWLICTVDLISVHVWQCLSEDACHARLGVTWDDVINPPPPSHTPGPNCSRLLTCTVEDDEGSHFPDVCCRQAAMVLNCEDINAHLTKKDAEELLRDVNRRLLSGGGFDKPVLV